MASKRKFQSKFEHMFGVLRREVLGVTHSRQLRKLVESDELYLGGAETEGYPPPFIFGRRPILNATQA